jgi:hypothetical protein
MAQVVGFFEDNVTYKEGPFVISNPLFNGWRIEVEFKGSKTQTPGLPNTSIYELEKKLGLDGKTFDKALIERICDELNQMVRDGKIAVRHNLWVWLDAKNKWWEEEKGETP